MFDGVAYSSVSGGEGTPPEIDLLHERLEMLTGGSSFSLHFGPEFSGEIPSSATLTVLLEGATPSVDAFVVGPFVSSTEAKADTFFPAGKATLSASKRQRWWYALNTDDKGMATQAQSAASWYAIAWRRASSHLRSFISIAVTPSPRKPTTSAR